MKKNKTYYREIYGLNSSYRCRDLIGFQYYSQVNCQVWDHVRAQVSDQVYNQVRDRVGSLIRDQLYEKE